MLAVVLGRARPRDEREEDDDEGQMGPARGLAGDGCACAPPPNRVLAACGGCVRSGGGQAVPGSNGAAAPEVIPEPRPGCVMPCVALIAGAVLARDAKPLQRGATRTSLGAACGFASLASSGARTARASGRSRRATTGRARERAPRRARALRERARVCGAERSWALALKARSSSRAASIRSRQTMCSSAGVS